MQDLLLDYALTAISLALIAWICAFISRPLFEARWAKISSQIAAVSLLFISSLFAKGMTENQDSMGSELFLFVTLYFVMRGIAIYLIACYAKSVGKSRYWAFVGLLNHLVIIPVLVFGLWKSEKRGKFTNDEMINKLILMIENPDTTSERKDWALKSLSALEKKSGK